MLDKESKLVQTVVPIYLYLSASPIVLLVVSAVHNLGRGQTRRNTDKKQDNQSIHIFHHQIHMEITDEEATTDLEAS